LILSIIAELEQWSLEK